MKEVLVAVLAAEQVEKRIEKDKEEMKERSDGWLSANVVVRAGAKIPCHLSSTSVRASAP